MEDTRHDWLLAELRTIITEKLSFGYKVNRAADAMMEYSVNNILMQEDVSMLTQANQFPNRVIELLNA